MQNLVVNVNVQAVADELNVLNIAAYCQVDQLDDAMPANTTSHVEH